MSLSIKILECSADTLQRFLSFLGSSFTTDVVRLDLGVYNGCSLRDAELLSIFHSFPRLDVLDLSKTDLQSLDPVLQAYGKGDCRLRVLAVDSGHVASVFEALSRPGSFAANTLQELSVVVPGDEWGHFLPALVSMLEHNRILAYLDIHLKGADARLIKAVKATLPRFHKQLVSLRDPHRKISLREKLAFLSVVAHYNSLKADTCQLDCGVASVILICAQPCQSRVVRIRNE